MIYNRIYNMDCLEGLKKINSNSVKLIVADPPIMAAPNKTILIFSTLEKSGRDYVSRSSGSDSIKCHIFDKVQNRLVTKRQRINRTQNWEERLKKKILDLGQNPNQFKK